MLRFYARINFRERIMLKQIVTGIICLLLLASFTQAETIITENHLFNQTWTLDGSPYVVTLDVTIVWGYLLTIEPGVVVKFADGAGLAGPMDVNGQEGAPVLFTSNSDTPFPGIFGFIEVQGDGGQAGLSHLVVEYATNLMLIDMIPINHTTVQHCSGDFSAALVIAIGSPGIIDHVTVRNNEGDGIYIGEWAGADLESCSIYGNGGTGLTEHALMGAAPGCEVRNSQIHHNGLDGVQGVKSLFNCEIYSNQRHGVAWGVGNPAPSSTCEIRDCSILQNGGSGIYVDTFVGTVPAVITACNITGNQEFALDLSHSHFYDTIDASGNYWGATTMDEIMATINLEPAIPGVDLATLVMDWFENTVSTETTTWGDLKARFR